MLEEAFALLVRHTDSQGITLRKDFQSALLNVIGCPDLLRQVFISLTVNLCPAMARSDS